jgi:hypothetical protein
VLPEVRAAVLRRDGQCFLAGREPGHQCFDGFDNPHAPTEWWKLDLDHFWHDGAHMGDRAPSDPEHMVAMCARGNRKGPDTKRSGWTWRDVRQAERDYVLHLP